MWCRIVVPPSKLGGDEAQLQRPKLAVNAAEAARVREIFALYLKLGSPNLPAAEVEKLVVTTSEIVVTFHPTAIKTLAQDQRGEAV